MRIELYKHLKLRKQRIKRMSVIDRFHSKYMPVTESGCWLWIGSINKYGYGHFSISRRTVLAHRFSYELVFGEIPENLHIDHKCRVTCCINPNHLEAVTPKENIRRGINAERLKTHCPQGHPYSGENLYKSPSGNRSCRTCRRIRDKKY